MASLSSDLGLVFKRVAPDKLAHCQLETTRYGSSRVNATQQHWVNNWGPSRTKSWRSCAFSLGCARTRISLVQCETGRVAKCPYKEASYKTVARWPWLVVYGTHSWLLFTIEHSGSPLVCTINHAPPSYNYNIITRYGSTLYHR